MVSFDQSIFMKSFFVFIACTIGSFTSANTYSQASGFTVSFINDSKKPLNDVTVELRRATDSSLVKAAISDKSGIAVLENIKPGNYFFKASLLNHSAYTSTMINVEEGKFQQIPTVNLTTSATQLSGVTVTSKKPFIQRF